MLALASRLKGKISVMNLVVRITVHDLQNVPAVLLIAVGCVMEQIHSEN